MSIRAWMDQSLPQTPTRLHGLSLLCSTTMGTEKPKRKDSLISNLSSEQVPVA